MQSLSDLQHVVNIDAFAAYQDSNEGDRIDGYMAGVNGQDLTAGHSAAYVRGWHKGRSNKRKMEALGW